MRYLLLLIALVCMTSCSKKNPSEPKGDGKELKGNPVTGEREAVTETYYVDPYDIDDIEELRVTLTEAYDRINELEEKLQNAQSYIDDARTKISWAEDNIEDARMTHDQTLLDDAEEDLWDAKSGLDNAESELW